MKLEKFDKILLDAFQFFLVGSTTARLNKTLDKIETNAYLATDRMGTKPTDNTVILFSTQTTEENIENAIKLVFDEINDLEINPPTKEELAIVKNKLKLNLAQVFESSELINQAVGTAMLDNDIQDATGDTLGYSTVRYTIKLWGDDLSVLNPNCLLVDAKMRELGFRRISANELVYNNQISKIFIYEGLGKEEF